jgi:uncharacterized protein
MRVVVDINIFVSAFLKESSWPGELVRWIDNFGGLLKSLAAEAQVLEVLQRPYFAPKLSSSVVDEVRRIFSKAELVTIV